MAGVPGVDDLMQQGPIGGAFSLGFGRQDNEYKVPQYQWDQGAQQEQGLGMGAPGAAGGYLMARSIGEQVNQANAMRDQYGARGAQTHAQQGLGSLAGMYDAAARGMGPSQAEILSKATADRNMASALSMAKGQRGGMTPGSLRAAQQANVQTGMETQAQMGALRAQEIAAAREGLGRTYGAMGGLAGQQRGQDLGLYGQAQNQEQAYLGMGLKSEEQRMAGQQFNARLGFDEWAARNRLNAATAENNANRDTAFGKLGLSDENAKEGVVPQGQSTWEKAGGFASGLGSLAAHHETKNADNADEAEGAKKGNLGGLMGLVGLGMKVASLMSDERAKESVSHGPGTELRALLESVEPVAYSYKPGAAATEGHGRHVGVMAQDLERTPAGRSMVVDTPRGKMVDGGKMAAASLAAAADLDHRVRALEARKAG